MKYIIAIFLILVLCNAFAQTNVFHENMENIDSVFSTGNPGWFANTRLQTSGLQCDSTSIAVNDTSFLETQSFDLTGYTYVIFNFDHICKLSFFDKGVVEIFNGTSWIQLTAQQMVPGQVDSAAFDGLGNVFSEAINPQWLPGQTVSPNNSWWRNVAFDLSLLLANVPNAKIRWSAIDFGTAGGEGRAGWFIDDVNVLAAPCELQPPALTQLAPIIQNNVLSTGPYTLNINLTDASGIDTNNVYLVYTINNGQPDTSYMANTSGNIFSGTIPSVSDSDTVCYYFSARDLSACFNTVRYPLLNCIQFVAQSGYVIPFCDDFDINNFWTPTVLSGSSWNYGAPTVSPASAHSAPNVWEVVLGAQYLGNTECYLTSPPVSFINVVNSSVDFWIYSDCENTWDGTRLEYSLNNGTNWSVLGNVGSGINWYNDASLNSSLLPGWTGNVSGTSPSWLNARHSLAVLNNQPNVLFRFVFTSDASVQDNGFAIDDFCIVTPIVNDAGVVTLSSSQPGLPPAGSIDSVSIAIKNFGGNTIQNIPVYFSVNNGAAIGPYIYNDTIQPLQTTPVFVLSGLNYTVPQGSYTLCAWTDYSTDNIPVNDTSCLNTSSVIVVNIDDSTIYCDNFDNGNVGWQSIIQPGGNLSTSWELGVPAVGQTNSVRSQPHAWDVNLTSVYGNNANTVLLSPYFNVGANANPDVSFWVNYNTETNWDGVRLEFSNDGIIWNTIGIVGDTAATYWYNTQQVVCSNQSGWTNSSNGWQFVQYRNMNFLNSQTIQLRFSFCSDGVVTRDGFTLDDFCFGMDTANVTAIAELQAHVAGTPFITNWPNPFDSETNIEVYIPKTSACKISITDIAGRLIKNITTSNFNKGKHNIKFSRDQLQAGTYLLNLLWDGRYYTQKVTVY